MKMTIRTNIDLLMSALRNSAHTLVDAQIRPDSNQIKAKRLRDEISKNESEPQ